MDPGASRVVRRRPRRAGIRIAEDSRLAMDGGKEAHVKKKTDAKQVVKDEQEAKAPAEKKRGRKQVAELLAAPEAESTAADAGTAGGAS